MPSRGYRPAPSVPVHLRPSAPTAPDALLCGDPARALAIAQRVLVKPRMSNHHRGLWGYHGETVSGRELTVQATGIGGPSAAIVVGELVSLGLRRAIRVGSCTAAAAAPPAGARLVVTAAIAEDGTSNALGIGHGAELRPDRRLTEALLTTPGLTAATVRSRDIPPRSEAGRLDEPGPGPVDDLQTAGLLASCARLGVAAGALLAVAGSAGRRLEDEPLEAAHLELGEVAAEVLATV